MGMKRGATVYLAHTGRFLSFSSQKKSKICPLHQNTTIFRIGKKKTPSAAKKAAEDLV